MKRYSSLLLLPLIISLASCQEETHSCCVKPTAEKMTTASLGPHTSHTSSLSDMSLYNLDSEWQNQDGKTVKLAELQGKAQLVSMIFTNCSYACPRIVADLKRIEAILEKSGRRDVGIVLVTMDPERDTPEKLKEFATTNKLDASRWTLLTSQPADIQELAALLNMKYRQEIDGNFAHSNIISVLNEQGELVHQQEGLGTSPDATVKAIQGLVQSL